MNHVYLVLEQVDDTHEEIKRIFSSRWAAEKYRDELVKDMGGEDYGHCIFINSWRVYEQ